MSSLRIERARDALDHHHGLLQQQQLRPRAHVEQAGDLEQQHQQLRHRDFVGGAVVDRLADGADRLREVIDRMMPRHIAGLEMHLGGAPVVAGDEAVEDLGEEAPLLRPEPAHDAEVDRDQVAVGVDEQVARMHVGVEEAVAQRVAQEGLDHRARQLLEIEALRLRAAARSVQRNAVDPFERQHVRAVRSQSTAGTRKSGSPWCSPPSRTARRLRAAGPSRCAPSGAALSATRSAAAAAPRPRTLSALRAAKMKASRSTAKRRSMPGRSTFTATGFGPSAMTTSARCTCAIEAAATAGPNETNSFASGLPSASLDRSLRPRPAGTAASGPAAISRSRASAMPTTSGRVARNCPSFT